MAGSNSFWSVANERTDWLETDETPGPVVLVYLILFDREAIGLL